MCQSPDQFRGPAHDRAGVVARGAADPPALRTNCSQLFVLRAEGEALSAFPKRQPSQPLGGDCPMGGAARHSASRPGRGCGHEVCGAPSPKQTWGSVLSSVCLWRGSAGFYSLLARALGHATASFEIQASMQPYLRASLLASGLSLGQSRLWRAAVSRHHTSSSTALLTPSPSALMSINFSPSTSLVDFLTQRRHPTDGRWAM